MTRKRTHSLLKTKQEALRLLGGRPDGTFGAPMLQPNSHHPHNATKVSKMLLISRTALYNWKQNAVNIMKADSSTKGNKKRKVPRQGCVPLLEQAVNTYIRDRINYMKGESLFRMDIICKIALNLRDELVRNLGIENQNDLQITPKEREALKNFKASPHWFQNFMLRNKFMSYKPRGQGAAADPVVVANSRADLKKTLCVTGVKDICNSDEVGVLFRSLPSRSVGTLDKATAYKRAKERLTAVLTVYADGTKAPLVIIGKSKKPRSFPKNFDPKADLGIYYYSQAQVWNTQRLWEKQVAALDHTARVEGRKVTHLIDNCSAHSVDNSRFENVDELYFPPNLTSVLQPIDAGVGRSFKAAFRRLLVSHVLLFINEEMKKPACDRSKFKMNQAVTIYDAVKMMSIAWDMVFKRVVVKSWLCCNILAPYQELFLHDAVKEPPCATHKVKVPIRGTALDTDMLLYCQRTAASKEKGLCFLEEINARNESVVDDAQLVRNVVSDDWLNRAKQTVEDDLVHLEELGVFDDICADELEAFEEAESSQLVCASIDTVRAVKDTVNCVLGLLDKNDGECSSREESERKAVVYEKMSL